MLMTIHDVYRARLRELVKTHGSQAALASAIDKSPAQLSQWLNATSTKGRQLSPTTAREIEVSLGLPEGWMDQPVEAQSQGQIPGLAVAEEPRNPYADAVPVGDNTIMVPRVRFKLSATASGFAIEYLPGYGGDPVFMPRQWFVKRRLNPKKVFAADVGGPSMLDGLADGDTVLVNTASIEPKEGIVFAALYEGEAVIKRLRRNAGRWWLNSDNPDQAKYPPKVCDEHCRLVGEVVMKVSENI